jgi:hypothetical protein
VRLEDNRLHDNNDFSGSKQVFRACVDESNGLMIAIIVSSNVPPEDLNGIGFLVYASKCDLTWLIGWNVARSRCGQNTKTNGNHY